MKQTIIVAEIRNTKNAQVKQLMLRTEIEKSAEANPVSFFMKGVKGISPSTERRVFFQSVSTDVIADHGIKEGSNFHQVFPQFPNARLVVRETFEQRKWDGGEQAPKVNPTTGQIMTREGKAIYRNVELSLDGKLEDNYIQHDVVSSGGIISNDNSNQNINTLVNKGSVMAEPSLPNA